MQLLQPHRWRSPQDEAPLFSYEDGSGLDREGITHYIRIIAALASGFPSELAGPHSLRKGGATAFYATTGGLERLKRYGGWTFDAVHAYIYEDHIAQHGISQGMLHAQLIPLQSQIDPQHRRALNGEDINEQAFHSSARAKSWGPDRRVPFATMAGDAAPPNLVNEANLFPSNHPGIDLYQIVAVEPGATPPAVLKAFRHKGRGLHPDKATDQTQE